MKNIEWCDTTINPVIGCSRGCPYCYAKKIVWPQITHFDDDENLAGYKTWKYEDVLERSLKITRGRVNYARNE